METAESIASHLLEIKLIACANIFPAGTSIYKWEGKIKKESEIYFILKTNKKLFKQVKEEILKIHPYDCPAIVEINVDNTHLPFTHWVKEQTKIT
jgi:periplasmic divalent cation tolerance protein